MPAVDIGTKVADAERNLTERLQKVPTNAYVTSEEATQRLTDFLNAVCVFADDDVINVNLRVDEVHAAFWFEGVRVRRVFNTGDSRLVQSFFDNGGGKGLVCTGRGNFSYIVKPYVA